MTSNALTRALIVGITFVAAGGAVIAACDDTSSINPVTGAGGTAGAAGAGAGGDAGLDASSDAGSDATDAGPPGLTCAALLGCDQKCGSSDSCTNACYAKATGVAQGLFNTFNNCLNAQCAGSDASDCDTTAATGPCINDLLTCESDKVVGPADPDGGGVVVPVSDAGQVYNCGQFLSCENNCSDDAGACQAACLAQATAEAAALAGALQNCLAMACPSTDGGPCVTPGLTCNGCIVQVELAEPDTCAGPYVACNSDTSNNPDGGSGPMSLVDGGTISTILSGLDQCASTLLVSGGYLYFTQVATNGPVLRYALGGDAGYTSVGPPQPTPVGLAIDPDNVYVWNAGSFTLGSSTNNGDGTVEQVALDGGASVNLFQNMELFYDATYLNAVAVDSQYVYWVAGAVGNDGAIMKAPKGGGSPAQSIFTGQYVPTAVVTDGTNVYWANLGTFDAQGISNGDGSVWQGSVNGGTPVPLASNQPTPYGIAVESGYVYWANVGKLGGGNLPALNAGSIQRVPIGGGAIDTIASSQEAPFAIIVHNGTIYWNEYGLNSPGLIVSASADGGAIVPLAAGLNDPGDMVVSGNTIYWANAESSPNNGLITSLVLP